MAARIPGTLRSLASRPAASANLAAAPQYARRSFQTSQRLMAEVAPVRKPVGAFRGTIFGFLLGSVLAGSGLYYYVIDEYKVSNALLTEDIYALQGAVQRLEGYVRGLEEDIKTSK